MRANTRIYVLILTNKQKPPRFYVLILTNKPGCGLAQMPTTAIGVMSSAHRSLQQAIQQKKRRTLVLLFCTPSGARTLDPNIKSVVLYQLS